MKNAAKKAAARKTAARKTTATKKLKTPAVVSVEDKPTVVLGKDQVRACHRVHSTDRAGKVGHSEEEGTSHEDNPKEHCDSEVESLSEPSMILRLYGD